MKAITLWQPWASLIAEGVKTIETRSWPAPASVIGETIAVHAAARRVTPAEWSVGEWTNVTGEPIADGLDEAYLDGRDQLVHTPLGVVVATARLAACSILRLIDVTDQRPYGHFEAGRYAWIFEDVEKLPGPVPARGRQGLWEWAA